MKKKLIQPLDESEIKQLAEEHGVPLNQICVICGQVIKVMAFQNTGACCEDHRKDRDNDHAPFQAVNLKIHEGEEK
jgi:hypothetical protein